MKSSLSRIEADVKYIKFSLSAFIEGKFRKVEGEIAEINALLAGMWGAGQVCAYYEIKYDPFTLDSDDFLYIHDL